jgi:primosomal protein N' (replication factor Y)
MLSVATMEQIALTLAETPDNVLIYLNRRGAYKAYICKDCSHTWKCDHCDVAMTLHTSPKNLLLCHHCHATEPMPETCPKCHGHQLSGIGIAVQSVEQFLRKEFPGTEICRLDRDQKNLVKTARIFIGTEYALRHCIGTVGLAISLLPESELNIPEFDIEERVYANIRALGSIARECVVETHAPKLPLIRDLLDGNYKSFLTRTLAERKRYRYPPYSGLAYIRVKHRNTAVLEDLCAKLDNKLRIETDKIVPPVSQVLYDRSVRLKRAGEYIDTIMIRSDSLAQILAPIRKEILRNRSIELLIR